MGKSTRTVNKDFSLEKRASDLQALSEHTGAPDPVLRGYGMGGDDRFNLSCKEQRRQSSANQGAILEHTTYTNPVKTILFAG